MPPTREREIRAAPILSLEGAEPTGRSFTARVLTYGPPDEFQTRWAPGVVTKSLGRRMPVLAWGHDWSDPVGRATDWHEDASGLVMDFELDDPAEVPRARQAAAQIRSGTLTDVSVGFVRRADRAEDDGTVTITEADLDEVSIVLRGAVSGAEILSIRSAEDGGNGGGQGDGEGGKRTLSTALIQDVALLMREGAIDPDGAREILRTGELPAASTQPAEMVAIEKLYGDPDPGTPTPSAPGHIDAPPEVEAPEEQEPSPAAPAPEQAAASAAPEGAGEAQGDVDLDAAEALAVIGGRSRG